MTKHKSTAQQGFTIVELMVATAVFSMVMLVCSFAIVQVGRMYYKGVVTNRTQDAARTVLEDVAQTVQFGANHRNVGVQGYTNAQGQTVTVHALCLGQTRYSYVTDRAMGALGDQARRVLWKNSIGEGESCTPANLAASTPPDSGEALLGDTMRLPVFDANDEDGDGVWTITVRVSFGDTADLFENNGEELADGDGTFAVCRGVNAGGQFCAVSNLSTSVVKRL